MPAAKAKTIKKTENEPWYSSKACYFSGQGLIGARATVLVIPVTALEMGDTAFMLSLARDPEY